MFENTLAFRHSLKKNKLLEQLEKAKDAGKDWLVKQIEEKLDILNKKYYPNVFWNSAELGTYKKEENKEE